MRFLSGRSRLTKALVAGTAFAVTAAAGIFVGAGFAQATTTGPVGAVFNTSAVFYKAQNTANPAITSQNWVNIASFNVFPNLTVQHVLVRFSAQTKCQAGSSDGWCTVRIRVNGNDTIPTDGTNFAWQWEGNNETWGARSIERGFETFQSPGSTLAITVDGAVHNGATSFIVQDWLVSATAF